mgnify:CR=1 FL=1
MELFKKKDEGIKKNIGREGGVTDMDKMKWLLYVFTTHVAVRLRKRLVNILQVMSLKVILPEQKRNRRSIRMQFA